VVEDAAALPVSIQDKDPHIRYVGRFDFSSHPMAEWVASSVLIKFHGTELNAKLFDQAGMNFWQIEVDGQPTSKMPLGKGEHRYRLASGLPVGDHTVRLMKATEAWTGSTQFLEFQLNEGGTLLQAPTSPCHVEVIGDSISCGAANEGKPGEARPSNQWGNAYYSYGAMTARKFGADYFCAAWSGWKMWPGPEKAIPNIYDRTLPTKENSVWDFSKFTADVVIINLSTNDFGKYPDLDLKGWIDAYEQFIARLRTHYPNAHIYCASSPMKTGKSLEASIECLTKITSDLNAKGDAKVHFIALPTQSPIDGIGGNKHPNIKSNERMAEVIAAQITKDLGWRPVVF